MKTTITALCILAQLLPCFAGNNSKPKFLLFIGNSLTYYNDMPQMLQKMFDEQHVNVKVEQLTLAGASLVSYAKLVENEPDIYVAAAGNEVPVGVMKIKGKKWDYVVVQENGSVVNPCFRYQSFEPSLVFLDSIIKRVGAKTVIYEHFAGNKFPHQTCIGKKELEVYLLLAPRGTKPNILEIDPCCSNIYYNSTDEYRELKQEYSKMAKQLNAGLVKIGLGYETLKKLQPSISLYDIDNCHPSKQGSYLMACMFYKYFTGRDASVIKYCADLDSQQAQTIRRIAASIR